MAEGFETIVIESQEQLDGMFKDRINRQNEKHAKDLAEKIGALKVDYEAQIETINAELAQAKETIKGFDTTIKEKDDKIRNYEVASVKSQIAYEMGLTPEAINFLQGDNEETIRKSAEALKSLVKVDTAPLAINEPTGTETEKAAFKSMLANLS